MIKINFFQKKAQWNSAITLNIALDDGRGPLPRMCYTLIAFNYNNDINIA